MFHYVEQERVFLVISISGRHFTVEVFNIFVCTAASFTRNKVTLHYITLVETKEERNTGKMYSSKSNRISFSDCLTRKQIPISVSAMAARLSSLSW